MTLVSLHIRTDYVYRHFIRPIEFLYVMIVIGYIQMGDDTNPNSVIEEIMESPEKLRDLDLDAFAEELKRQVCTIVVFLSKIPYSAIY